MTAIAQHAAAPRLCAECEAQVRAKAEQAKPNHMILYICEHDGITAVVAVGFMRGNTIVGWHIEGPLPLDAVVASVKAIVAAAEKRHMSLQLIPEPH